MSMKKATSTRSVMVESFGLDQFGGEVGGTQWSRQSLMKQACLIERMSMKKAKATHRVALRSFGLDQFGGEVGAVKRSRQSKKI
jgi:hypothetical protein